MSRASEWSKICPAKSFYFVSHSGQLVELDASSRSHQVRLHQDECFSFCRYDIIILFCSRDQGEKCFIPALVRCLQSLMRSEESRFNKFRNSFAWENSLVNISAQAGCNVEDFLELRVWVEKWSKSWEFSLRYVMHRMFRMLVKSLEGKVIFLVNFLNKFISFPLDVFS